MSLEILKQDLKNKNLRKGYLFYGVENYLKRFYLENLEKIILEGAPCPEMNKVVLEGKVRVSDICDACDTLPVFAAKKLIVVRNTHIFNTTKKRSKKASVGGYPDILNNLPDYACVVFLEEEIESLVKSNDLIKKTLVVVEFAYQNPDDLAKWIVKAMKSNNKEIDLRTSAQIVDYCEPLMDDILNEIQKIVLFMGDRTSVTLRDVEEVCSKSIKGRIFELTDALLIKDCEKSYRILNELMLLKEPIQKLLIVIAKQFQRLLEVKLLSQKGLSASAMAKQFQCSTFMAEKLGKHCKNFSLDKLKAVIYHSFEMDIAIKNGNIGDRSALELLIAGILME